MFNDHLVSQGAPGDLSWHDPSARKLLTRLAALLGTHREQLGSRWRRLSPTEQARMPDRWAWSHVDLTGRPDDHPSVPPSIAVWRSVRAGGDTKTKKSRRTLALPRRCVDALTLHRQRQDRDRQRAGTAWQNTGLVFTTSVGTALDAANIRRAFRRVAGGAGLDAADWTPWELRHSFVSLLSDSGVSLEDIADLCGHSGTRVTESVYRRQLRPVLLDGAITMDRIFQPEPRHDAR